MKILGLDLSLACTGYCILDKDTITYGEIKTKADKASDIVRIAKITGAIDKLVKKHKIKLVAIEDTFHGPNTRVFKQLAWLAGAVMQLLGNSKKYNLRLYMATSARNIVGLSGRAPKCLIQLWVCQRYGLVSKKFATVCSNQIDEALLNRKTNKKHSDKIFKKVSIEIKNKCGLTHDMADAVLLAEAYKVTSKDSPERHTHKMLKRPKKKRRVGKK